MKITVLGSGASSGSPVIGGEMPQNPKNIRQRASVFIEGANTNILIDTSPDLRMQALQNKITKVDAVLYTHAHADHIHGIDDIKSFNYLRQGKIPAYGNEATMSELQERFEYCFSEPVKEYGWYKPCLTANIVKPLTHFTVGEFEVLPYRQIHTKRMDSLGFRIGNFAYSTDVKTIPPETDSSLKNLDLWIVDCLKEAPMPTHSDLKQTLQWVQKFKPRRTVLTHLSFQMDYDHLCNVVPQGVEVAYDGMILEV